LSPKEEDWIKQLPSRRKHRKRINTARATRGRAAQPEGSGPSKGGSTNEGSLLCCSATWPRQDRAIWLRYTIVQELGRSHARWSRAPAAGTPSLVSIQADKMSAICSTQPCCRASLYVIPRQLVGGADHASLQIGSDLGAVSSSFTSERVQSRRNASRQSRLSTISWRMRRIELGQRN
jgi:hypothetical protein